MSNKNSKFENGITRNLRVMATLGYMPQTKTIYEGDKSVEIDENHPKWNETKWSFILLIPKKKTDIMSKKLLKTLDDINKEAIDKGYIEREIPIGGTATIKNFVRDGDDKSQFKKYQDYYKNHWVLSVKIKGELKNIYTIDGVPVTKENVKTLEDEIYSGVKVLATLFIYFVKDGNMGIYASLTSMRVTEKTPRFFEKQVVTFEELKLTPEEVAYLEAHLNDIGFSKEDNSNDEDYQYDYE